MEDNYKHVFTPEEIEYMEEIEYCKELDFLNSVGQHIYPQ